MAQTYKRKPGGRYRRPYRHPLKTIPRRKNTVSRILSTLRLLLLCLLVAVPASIGGAYAGIIKKVDELQGPAQTSTQPTYIYSEPLGDGDDTRRVLASVFQGQNRETASLEEMPPYLLNAVVAKEDKRFREHSGVDVWGILRALYADVRAGAAVQGGSTITQQYVKNAYLSSDQTISRKVKEAVLAIEVGRRYSKNEILGMYLNALYFGNNAYGIEAAAQTYYDKSVEDLTLPESATLVGLLRAPSAIGSDKESAREQRNLVLEQMFEAGYINRQEYLESLEKPMPQEWPMTPMSHTGLSGPGLTKGFADYVQQQLVERYGARTVRQGGFSVYTTLNLETQMQARETLYGSGEGYLNDSGDPDAALVSVSPKTGEIEAMVGNRDPEAEFNLATQAQRQPGSSFKPFAMIAALEQGIDPGTKFTSEKKTYTVNKPDGITERWKVENYEDVERGRISLKEALWMSDNTVFTDLVMNADGKGLKNGPEKVVEVAKRLGISANFGEYTHPSVVLGTQEVSPMEMATAYATIANHGRRVEPTAISKVVKNEGKENEKVLYTASRKEGEQVIDREIADKVIKLMEGDIDNGISKDASLGGRDASGKSGTTENFFDAWFIGSTPQLTTAVWMGYAKGGKTLDSLDTDHETITSMPENIWRSYMEEALEGKPEEEFEGEPEPPEGKEEPQKRSTTSGSTVGNALQQPPEGARRSAPRPSDNATVDPPPGLSRYAP